MASFQIVLRAFGLLFGDFKRFLDIAWPWLGISTLAVYAVERMRPMPGDVIENGLDPLSSLLMVLLPIVHLGALCGFFAKWSRWLVQGEMPSGAALVAFSGREIKVLLMTIIISMPLAVPLFLFALYFLFGPMQGLTLEPEEAGRNFLAILLAGAIGVYFMIRMLFSPILAALDGAANPLADSWRLTKGRAGRLFYLMFLAVAPTYLLEALVLFALVRFLMALGVEPGELHDGAVGAVLLLMTILVNFVLLALLMTVQALALQIFRQEDASIPPG